METSQTSLLKLYRSKNQAVRIRAAAALLRQHDEIPLPVLLSILDNLAHEGLGAATERVLKRRRDRGLGSEMISRLRSPDPYIREVACDVLGSLGDRAATAHLLALLNDPAFMVRRAAGFALGSIKDPASIAELKRQYELQKNDPNMELAIGSSLRELGVMI